MNRIETLELETSHFQTTAITNIDKTYLGISWVILSLEKNLKEEETIIKKWMI